MPNLDNQESIIKLNKKNYTLWILQVQNELQKRKLFDLVVNDDQSNRERSYSNQWDNYNYSRQILKDKKQDALDFLLSTLNNEIQDEVQCCDCPNKLWQYLKRKYSFNSIKRLDTLMNDLKTIKFNFENYDLFIERFKKIVNKINDCGLELEDNYLNFYLLASLKRSKRINNSINFHEFLNLEFDKFKNKLKDSMIDPPDSLEFKNDLKDHYSDISNESFNYDLSDDNQQLDDKKKNLNDLNNKIDFNLMKYSKNIDKFYDNKNNNNFTNNELDTQNSESLTLSRRSDAFPILFSPIKSSIADQINNHLDIDNENDTPNKIYEDLNPATSDFDYSTCKEEKSTSFMSAQDNDIKMQDLSGDQLNLSIAKSTTLQDNYQLDLDEQYQKENINLPDIKIDTDSKEFFYIDKNGSY